MQEVKAPCSKMELQLHRLRHLNQDLLQRLKANQKAFQKQKQSKHLPKAPLAGRATPERTPESQKRKPGQEQLLKGVSSATMAERAPQAHQGGSGSPPKISDAEGRKRYRQGHVHPTSPRGAENFVGSATAACKTVTDRRSLLGTQTKPTLPATDMAAENRLELMGILEGKGPKDWRKSEGRTPEEGKKRPSSRARILNTPKSILLTPQSKEANEKPKKEASRVTFVSEPEYSVSRESWSVRPFLGYDWIAGLLDVDSSLSEKSEQYFSDLQDFRRVNREDCIYDRDLESDMLGASAYIREQDEDAASHQCVYCYRINKRLFAVPLDSKAACPICKTPRAQRPPETLVEPAFVRVSIPRSTLLPPYKHKIHRRSSYEPADNLGLPSHCLSGWEKSLQAARPTFSSLDLYSSLETRPVNHSYWKSVSRVSGGMATDELLNISRAAEFELSNISREQKQLFSKSTPPVRR